MRIVPREVSHRTTVAGQGRCGLPLGFGPDFKETFFSGEQRPDYLASLGRRCDSHLELLRNVVDVLRAYQYRELLQCFFFELSLHVPAGRGSKPSEEQRWLLFLLGSLAGRGEVRGGLVFVPRRLAMSESLCLPKLSIAPCCQ